MSERPLSPHLQVYRPQLTSVLSITHRATGVALSIAAITVVWSLYKGSLGPEGYDQMTACWRSWFGSLVMLGTAASTFFHLANGIRHLFWDAGAGLEIETVYRSGYAVLAFTVIATLVAASAIFGGG